jgi:hypothetical protein
MPRAFFGVVLQASHQGILHHDCAVSLGEVEGLETTGAGSGTGAIGTVVTGSGAGSIG